MKKNLYYFFAPLWCFLFSFNLNAQQWIWGITRNPDGGSVYYVKNDGSAYQKSFATGINLPAGKDPLFILKVDKTIFGVSSTGPENQGLIFYLHENGIRKVASLDVGVLSRATMIQGKNEMIYGVASGANGSVLFTFRKDGRAFRKVVLPTPVLCGDFIASKNGDIYGLSENGGKSGSGFLFRVKADLSGIDLLFHFNGPSGKQPAGKLTELANGELLGATRTGGKHNLGTLFRIKKNGRDFAKLHDFNTVSGSNPTGGLAVAGNMAFGMTESGGSYKKGTIFRINLNGGGYKVLHHFNGLTGEHPTGSLVQNQKHDFIGIANGIESASGFLFTFQKNGNQYKILKQFHGERPLGQLLIFDEAVTPGFRLLSPKDGSDSVDVFGLWRTTRIPSALQYTIELSTYPDFSDAVAYSANSPEFQPENIRFNTRYYARVMTSLWPGFGPTTSFVTRTAEAYAFIESPADGATDVTAGTLKISASIFPGATTYQVDISLSADFVTDETESKSSAYPGQRQFVFNNIQPGKTYYARVITELNQAFGRTTTFQTATKPVVTIAEPSNGAQNIDPSIFKIKLNTLPGAGRCTVAISSTSDFQPGSTRIIAALRDDQKEFVVRGLDHDQTYYIKANTETGSEFGPTIMFTTRKASGNFKLWGLTTKGGSTDQGTIFSFDLADKTFSKHQDYYHEYDFVYLSGNLSQTTDGFAALSVSDGTGAGEVFTLSSDGNTNVLETYGSHDGNLMLASDNYLYIIDDWINEFRGGIYRIHADGDSVFALDRIIHRFGSIQQGRNPVSALTEHPNRFLYGNAPIGGTYGKGTIYRLRADGSQFQVVHSFNGSGGATPRNAVIVGEDRFLYGVAETGGTHNQGVIFKVDPDGNNYQVLISFNGANGKHPKGELLAWDGKLFGMASMGGSADQGIIFSLRNDGSSFNVLHHFNGADGSAPLGGLTIDREGSLFGMTSAGGDAGVGTIFRIHANGTGFETLFNLSAETGGVPNGTLLLLDDESAAAAMSIADKKQVQIETHPNPSIDMFRTTITAPADHQVYYHVSDINGHVVYESQGLTNQQEIFGHNLPRGIYILKITCGDQVITQRLVKE